MARKTKNPEAATRSEAVTAALAMAAADTAVINMAPVTSAAFMAVAKTAEKQASRDDLPAGFHADFKASLAVEITTGGRQHVITRDFAGTLDVNPDSTRATSHGPTAGEIVAYLLSQVNAAQRAATLRSLAEVYAANGNSLPVSEEAVSEANEAMEKLRQKETQAVRGSVRVNAKAVAK